MTNNQAAVLPGGPRPDVWAGFWRLADPKISLASIASIFLGTMAALALGPIPVGWLVLTVLGIFAIEVAKNASGEVFDWDSGVDQRVAPEDRSPFSGGKRVLVDGLLTRGQTWTIAVGGYILGIAIGLLIVLFREPGVLALGMAGVAIAYFYHAPPLKFSYRGLGELAVGFAYGPLILCGTFLVLRGYLPLEVFWLSLPLGLMISAFLWINEFPDYRADRAAGKRTLVVQLGRSNAARAFAGMVALAFGLLALLPLTGASAWVWLGFIGLPPAIGAARRLLSGSEDTARLIPAQARTLVSFLLLSAGAGISLLLSSLL